MPRGEEAQLAATSSFSTGDTSRGIRIRLLGGDVPGGDFHAPGGRMNWLLEYTRGGLFIEVPCYSASSSVSFKYEGSEIERSYEKAYALPVDIIRETFKVKYRAVFDSQPSDIEFEQFLLDLTETLFLLSQPMAEAMHRWLGKDLDLQVVHFEAFPEGSFPIRIDWPHVGNAAKAALASVQQEA